MPKQSINWFFVNYFATGLLITWAVYPAKNLAYPAAAIVPVFTAIAALQFYNDNVKSR